MGYLRDPQLDELGASKAAGHPERIISSPWTFAIKFIWPGVHVACAGTLLIGGMFDLGRAKMTNFDLVALAIIFALLLGMIYWDCVPLKRVKLTNEGLLVSNYRTEILVPFGSIRFIESGRRVRVYLETETLYDRSFVFAPTIPRRLWRESPIVTELRELVQSASKS